MRKIILLLNIFTLLISIIGCDRNPANPEYQKEIVITGYLWGNKPMSGDRALMIAYTQPISAYFDAEQAGIRNARVQITEIATGKSFRLFDATQPGFYFNDSLIARPNHSYRLQVEVDGKTVTAVTTVPPELGLETTLNMTKVDSFFYNGISKEKPILLASENPEQIVTVDMYCNETFENAEYITKFWGQEKPGDREEYEGASGNDEPRHIIATAKIKDFTSPDYPGQFVIDWYSSMLVFYGSYTMQVLAIDENYYNFLNYRQFPELKAGVVGGIGVFGSVCGETFQLYVLKR